MISSRWISPPATWKAKNPSSHSTSKTANSVINIEISFVTSVLPPVKLDGNLFAPSAPLRRLKRRGQRRESRASRQTRRLLEFGLTVQPITDDKALHGEPFRGDVKQIGRAGARLCFVVAGDAATGDDPAMHTQCRE